MVQGQVQYEYPLSYFLELGEIHLKSRTVTSLSQDQSLSLQFTWSPGSPLKPVIPLEPFGPGKPRDPGNPISPMSPWSPGSPGAPLFPGNPGAPLKPVFPFSPEVNCRITMTNIVKPYFEYGYAFTLCILP